MTHYVISDTHFGHQKLSDIRGFPNIEDHDAHIISGWNSIVTPSDTVYHLGDVCMKKTFLQRIPLLNGRKILIKGNHDILDLQDYLACGFKDIRACVVRPNSILTHIPIHPNELSRFKMNIHGHLHAEYLEDMRYVNVSVENIDYIPVNLDRLEIYAQSFVFAPSERTQE